MHRRRIVRGGIRVNSSVTGARPIAIIGGTGPAGMGLALRWARAGETIIIGSRDEQRAQQAAASIQQRIGDEAKISGMENAAACAAADILTLTVPFEGQAGLLKRLKSVITEGSILIDATVALAVAVGTIKATTTARAGNPTAVHVPIAGRCYVNWRAGRRVANRGRT